MTREVITIAPETSLARAFGIMRCKRFRHLPVLDGRGRLVGLVTHRDLLAASTSSLEHPIEEERVELLRSFYVDQVMETHLDTACPDADAAEAGRRMVRHKIGCLPVVESGERLVGILTEEDFLRWATEHMAPGAGEASVVAVGS
jgi:CBS domain-containing membrane protein